MRASTLVQGASRRPRGGGTMTVLSGFSSVSRQETWEEVPASGSSRGVEPLLPRGRRQWDKRKARCARWSRGRATAPLKAASQDGRTRTVTRQPGRPRRVRDGTAAWRLWVVSATAPSAHCRGLSVPRGPWRHEPLGTQGMRGRTPSGRMARPGAIPHTQWRNCFPAFPIVKPGGPFPGPAARAD